MQLVEQHVIDRNDPRYAALDAAAFASKNLYNAALYVMRQSFINEGKRLSYNQMDKLMKQHEAYKALPAKVAQQVLMQHLPMSGRASFRRVRFTRKTRQSFVGVLVYPNTKTKRKDATCWSIQRKLSVGEEARRASKMA